ARVLGLLRFGHASLPLLLLAGALLAGDRPTGAAALAGVGAGALAVNREVAAVALTAIAVDLHEPGDVLAHFAAQVAFDDEVLIDVLANAQRFLVCKVTRATIGADARLSEN